MESKKIFDIDTIIKKCDSIEDKNVFINYFSQILKEKQKSFLYQLYAIMKKDFMIKTLEKTLKIMNEGGLPKNNKNEEKVPQKNENSDNLRTVGGTFIHLVKTSDLVSKDALKWIFWRNKKKKEMKRKLYKSLYNLNINNNNNKTKEKNKIDEK